MRPGSGIVTARKAFLSPWTGCDKKGEGCGERENKGRRNVSDEPFLSVRTLWRWDEGFPSFCCASLLCV